MPEPSIDELIDRYGGELSSGHYGVAVIETVDATMQNAGVFPNVSDTTWATIAALETAAYEVLTGGADLEALVNLAVRTAMDLAGQIATEALSSAAGSVPVLGEAFRFVAGMGARMTAQAQAERIAQAKRDYQSCLATADGYTPIGTGDFSATTPSDLFVRADRVRGRWVTETPIRVPYVGQMLQLIGESRWPGWLLHFLRVVRRTPADPSDPSTWGYVDGPIWRSVMGHPMHAWDPKRFESIGPWFPETDWYVPELRRLREAIRDMHPLRRERRGLPAGDQGQSLWPLYQDLLYAILEVDRHPFTRPGELLTGIKDRSNFSHFVPPLPYGAAIAIYGGPIGLSRDSVPNGLGAPGYQAALQYVRSQGGKVPELPEERLCRPCWGQPNAAVGAVYEMARSWYDHSHPLSYELARQQKDAVPRVAELASQYARRRLEQLGVTRPGATGGVAGAKAALQQLNRRGQISDRQATEAAEALNGGAEPGRLALYLGAGAVGLGALAWALS